MQVWTRKDTQRVVLTPFQVVQLSRCAVGGEVGRQPYANKIGVDCKGFIFAFVNTTYNKAMRDSLYFRGPTLSVF